MSIKNNTSLRALLLATLTLGPLTSAWARPSMWWDHFESAVPTESECVKQAETILTAEKAGELSADSDSVRAWTDKSVTVAECIRFGDKLIVAILVSSDDPAAGNALYNALRTGMKKKPASPPAGGH